MPNGYKDIVVLTGQTLEDVAVQEYGTPLGVVALLEDNALGMNSPLYPGISLKIREAVPTITKDNIALADYFRSNSLKPVTGVVVVIEDQPYVDPDYVDDNYVE